MNEIVYEVKSSGLGPQYSSAKSVADLDGIYHSVKNKIEGQRERKGRKNQWLWVSFIKVCRKRVKDRATEVPMEE